MTFFQAVPSLSNNPIVATNNTAFAPTTSASNHPRSGGSLSQRHAFVGVLLMCLVQAALCWFVPTTQISPIGTTNPRALLVPTQQLLIRQQQSQRQYTKMTASTDASSATEQTPVNQNEQPNATTTTKRLICIRHARSEGNEFLAQPGNQWGDPTFCDNATLIDAKLSEAGLKQVQDQLLPELLEHHSYDSILKQVDLVLISPLTRTLETFQYGVLPALKQVVGEDSEHAGGMPPILAHPLCTERVYTASDTGRSAAVLEHEFPFCDFSLVAQYTSHSHQHHGAAAWWYTPAHDPEGYTYQEWRPHGEGQWYAVPGEPMEVFTLRMENLKAWIQARPEQTILLVAHWGVLRYLTGCDTQNCEVKVMEWKAIVPEEEDVDQPASC